MLEHTDRPVYILINIINKVFLIIVYIHKFYMSFKL